jgi:nucleoside-diphosphate kinase
MPERTLVLLKPDAVQLAVIGELLSRFEKAGLKIIGLRMVWADDELAQRHYTEDLANRRGEAVRRQMLDYLVEGPVVAVCLEGIEAIDVVRKIIGSTEPKSALPGTIRGDYAHVSLAHANANDIASKNLVHASGNAEDAAYEIPLWFCDADLHSYKNIHDAFSANN